MHFPIEKVLYEGWVEYRVGSNILALAHKTVNADDASVPIGAAGLQLAFRVAPAEVDACVEALKSAGVSLLAPPPIIPGVTAPCFSATPMATFWRSMPKYRSVMS